MTAFFAPERCESAALLLRGYLPGDGHALLAAKASSYEHLRPWMAWAAEKETLEENEALVRKFRADYLTNTDFTIGVWSPDESRLLGGTGFHIRGPSRTVADAVAEIGMWIAAEHAGRGLGTAVLRAMLAWGFTEWPWERLAWHCDARNVASRRVAEKAGMRLEGRLRGDKPEVGEGRRDTLLFGMTRAEIAASR